MRGEEGCVPGRDLRKKHRLFSRSPGTVSEIPARWSSPTGPNLTEPSHRASRDRPRPEKRAARGGYHRPGLALRTVYCCAYSYAFGYRREGRMLGVADIHPILGIPSWVVWGILAPWVACALFTFGFAGFFMADDDLGQDHSSELESDIREGGLHE